jgi:hypothetical protein
MKRQIIEVTQEDIDAANTARRVTFGGKVSSRRCPIAMALVRTFAEECGEATAHPDFVLIFRRCQDGISGTAAHQTR